MRRISLEVAHDHVESLTRFQNSIIPIEELVWNGLDADATQIEVSFEENEIDGLVAIRVRDNGHGISHDDCERAFGSLGGSNKVSVSKTPGGRIPHGKSGKGRFRAFGLGPRVCWRSRYRDQGGVFEFEIRGDRGSLRDFDISQPIAVPGFETGVEVGITGIDKNFPALSGKDAVAELSRRLALYLMKYPGITIRYDGEVLDPEQLIERETTYKLFIPPFEDGHEAGDLTVIEWKGNQGRALYLCDDEGFARYERPPGIQAPGYSFTAYLKSPIINDLDEQDAFALGDLHPTLNSTVDLAKDWLRTHFRQRDAERAADLVQKWKNERVYPYQDWPTTPIEKAEREVFDICALKVNEYLPGFDRQEPKNKQLTFRLIREALKSSPDRLQTILREVLSLPPEQQEDLAAILERTSLSAVLNAAKVVMDRLAFLGSLDDLLFGQYRSTLLERKQLQRILVRELWVFGEQYALGVDDESLKRLLQSHADILGRSDISPDEDVFDLDGRTRIVDLMLYRRYPRSVPGQFEHLVIELKRPSCRIGKDEIGQIEDYAFAVARDERFDKVTTQWNFILVGNQLTDQADQKCRVRGKAYGHIHESEDSRINIFVRPWSGVIQQAKWRYEFFREQLEYQVGSTDGLRYIHKKYGSLLPTIKPTPSSSGACST